MTALFNDKTHYCFTVMQMQIYILSLEDELTSQLRSAFNIKSGDSLCDDRFNRNIRGICSALQLNLGSVHCKFCLLVSMVVQRAVFLSLIVEDKSSFTATNSADPVGLLHSVCAMVSPVEGVALAIINDIVFSALASSELDGVGRWRVHWRLVRQTLGKISAYIHHSDTTGPLVLRIIKL